MAETIYERQARGDSEANSSYWAAMDASMAQKTALCSAHFLLDRGARLADMGCGSGYGTYLLAALNPQAEVIGVDINPEAIAHARTKWHLPNLSFLEADATKPVFAGEPVDGILSCSAFHHYYSFNGYSRKAVRESIANHMACLKPGGRLVLRDFVAPDKGEELIEIEMRSVNQIDKDVISLLRNFAIDARGLAAENDRGFFMEEVKAQAGYRRFRLPRKWAVEFVLRKDYASDWEVEILEEYTYFTPGEFSNAFANAGARLIHLLPHQNEWIVKNRFEGKFRLYNLDGSDLDWPATHAIAVAERTESHTGFEERRQSGASPHFFHFRHFEDENGRVTDIVSRPETVSEILPWRRDEGGRIRVLARSNSPRPVVRARHRGWAALDGAYWSGHMIEPIATSGASCEETLLRLAGIEPDLLSGNTRETLTYFPSPGGFDEFVVSSHPEIKDSVPSRCVPDGASIWEDGGEIREFDLQALIKAAQVGMLPEARLEMNGYSLLHSLDERLEPWIAEAPDLEPAEPRMTAGLDEALSLAENMSFRETTREAGYLEHHRSTFAAIKSGEDGSVRGQEFPLEFILPAKTSPNTAVILPVARTGDGWAIGLERLSLAVPYLRTGDSRHIAASAYRLPTNVRTLRDARRWIADRSGAPIQLIQGLGQPWFASSGATPERVFPFVIPVTADFDDAALTYVPLAELLARHRDLRDAHLLITMFRLAHALDIEARTSE